MWVVSYTKELVFAVVIKLDKQLEIQNKVNEKLNGKGEMSKYCKATVSMNLVGQYWQKHPQTFQGEKSGKAVFLSN